MRRFFFLSALILGGSASRGQRLAFSYFYVASFIFLCFYIRCLFSPTASACFFITFLSFFIFFIYLFFFFIWYISLYFFFLCATKLYQKLLFCLTLFDTIFIRISKVMLELGFIRSLSSCWLIGRISHSP